MSNNTNQDPPAPDFRRTEFSSAVEIHLDEVSDGVASGRIIDVGVGGIRALLDEEIPEGALCTVCFTDPDVGERSLRGFVRRTSPSSGGFLVGVEFEVPLQSFRTTPADEQLDGLDLKETRILVVDDEPGVVELLYRFLSGLGCEVLTARSGEEALEVLRREAPDFTLLDIRMPGMSGLEVLDTIREEGLDAGRVCVVSGYANDDEARDALQRGASDFISKPLDLKYLEWSMRLHLAAT